MIYELNMGTINHIYYCKVRTGMKAVRVRIIGNETEINKL